MAYELKLPDIGEGIQEGRDCYSYVKQGDAVKDDVFAEVQTDKAVVEIPCPCSTGTVAEVRVKEGEVINVGSVWLISPPGGGRSRRCWGAPR